MAELICYQSLTQAQEVVRKMTMVMVMSSLLWAALLHFQGCWTAIKYSWVL
jgi:hypothetical protein